MEELKSRVYIVIDDENRIIQIEGEYSLSNIADLSTAILVEEGAPCDRLNHAQNNYLDKPLRTDDGILRYKWTGTEIAERTDAEMDVDRAEIPPSPPQPTDTERLEAQVAENTADIETLNDAVNILLGGETDA